MSWGMSTRRIARRLGLTLPASVICCLLFAGFAQAAAPVNTTAPLIQGTNVVGNQLTDSPVGLWNPASVNPVTYQWEDCSGSPLACSPIAGATSPTYTVAASDAGYAIEVQETADDGSVPTDNYATASSDPALPPAPTKITAPTISGTNVVGDTLTEAHGTWTNAPNGPQTTYTYQWEDCSGSPLACTDITGATSQTYVVATADAGYALEVQEIATNAGGPSAAASSAAALPAVPLISTAPTFSGTVALGDTLTEAHGTWTNAPTTYPTTYTYQWEDCSGSPLACTAISGATGLTYVVASTDAGDAIEVQETATNAGGPSLPASSTPVLPAAPANTVLPKISGTVALGDTLTLTQGTWSNAKSITDQWEDCSGSPLACTAISGATGLTYVVASTDAGRTIEVLETATNAGGSSSVSSSGMALTAPPTNGAAPRITGVVQQGQTLTESHGQWTNNPTSYAITWYRCDGSGANCATVAGATPQTYALTSADVGGTIVVEETASNAGGAGIAYSALTSVVTTPAGIVPPPTPVSPPTVSGTAKQGGTLTASQGTWGNNPDGYSYQWMRCNGSSCAAIAGANTSSYAISAADVGYAIDVTETAINTGGTSIPVVSGRTSVVTATSATTLVAPSHPVTDQSVTLVATVTSSSGNASPSGSITFKAGNSAIGGCANEPVSSSGQSATVTCQTIFAAGTDTVSAVYVPAGGSLVIGSSSPGAAVTVGPAPTSIALDVSNSVDLGAFTTYRATVDQPEGSGPIEPSSTIEFLDHNKPISACRSRSLVSGKATCRLKYKSTGKHSITATYGGDSNFSGSRSSAQRVKAVVKLLGYITSNIAWSVTASSTHTWFTQFLAYAVSPGTSLFLTCHGHGCPFVTHTTAIGKGPRCVSKGKGRCPTSRTINLLAVFHGAHVGVGSKITLSILRCGWYGRYYTLVIRPLRQPSQVIVTLGNVGVTRRGLRC
jgi:Bacterial Ig-like domain (group 3)